MKMTRERNAWIGLILLLTACILLFRKEQAVYDQWAIQEQAVTAPAGYLDQDLAEWYLEETNVPPPSAGTTNLFDRTFPPDGSARNGHSYP